MKKLLDWQHPDIVNIYDEVNLWTAPFGRLLLDNIPMKNIGTILDLGFGTGFPLIELAQRFGADTRIIGMDIWPEAIKRTKKKQAILELGHIEIIEQSADHIPLADHTVDLITSNLGINNFENKSSVYKESFRVLKPNGHLSITSNPIGTFQELFDILGAIFIANENYNAQVKLQDYLQHRSSEKELVSEIEAHGFTHHKVIRDEASIRFTNALAILNHSLIRIGFRSAWDNLVDEHLRETMYKDLIEHIEGAIYTQGEFVLSIPILYLEFQK